MPLKHLDVATTGFITKKDKGYVTYKVSNEQSCPLPYTMNNHHVASADLNSTNLFTFANVQVNLQRLIDLQKKFVCIVT